MNNLHSKLPAVGTTVFTTMSALANEVGAVNLGQGFPDFDCDIALLASMEKAMRAGHNQYPPMAGVVALREAISRKVQALYGREYAVADEITVTAGATQAIHTASTAIVHPGDEVIIFEPVYDSYEPSIRMNGGVPIYARLVAPDFKPNWQEVSALITPRTRAIMINSPHNPTGTIWSRADLDKLYALVKNTDIIVISDEVYEHMVFDGAIHCSVAAHPGLAARAFVISSFGKTYHVTGWKIAYACAPRELMAEFRKAHQFIVFTVHTPSQYAIADYMQAATHLTLPHFYQTKRDLFLKLTAQTPFQFLPCAATYFVLASYAGMQAQANMREREFSHWLTRDVGVACIPMSAFYHDEFDTKLIRFCFAKKEATLQDAAHRLVAGLN